MLKDKIWGSFLKILKRWTRAGIFDSVEVELNRLKSGSIVLSIGGFGAVDAAIKHKIAGKNITFETFDIDPKHSPDSIGDVQNLSEFYLARKELPDLIIALEVLEHVENPTVAIEECHKALSADGVLVFSTPWITPIHDRPHDYWRMTPQALRQVAHSFPDVKIFARGNQFDSILALLLRGLFSSKKSLKVIMILASGLSLLLPRPKLYSNLEEIDSTIGYVTVCRK